MSALREPRSTLQLRAYGRSASAPEVHKGLPFRALFHSITLLFRRKPAASLPTMSPGLESLGKASARSSPRAVRSCVFSLSDIRTATRNFSPELKIGQGGFGVVYRGTLADGTAVAVKRAKKGGNVSSEFQSEITIMARIEHKNLVRLFGYLEEENERIIVAEYIPNGNLRDHLDRSNGKFLDMGARLDIAIDVAHAVTYLHMYAEHPIIHRDIKPSNILLTNTLQAKVADFGFARRSSEDANKSYVSTQVKGTAGYVDPEYLRTFHLTEKSDVYSFGVLLVELMSGRRPIEVRKPIRERLTLNWAMEKLAEGKAELVLDPVLHGNPAAMSALKEVLHVAHKCVRLTRQERPPMRRCCEELWNIRRSYKEMLSLSDSGGSTAASSSSSGAMTSSSSSGPPMLNINASAFAVHHL